MKAPVKGGGDFEPAPAGNQLGIVTGIYYLGAQDFSYQGEEKIRHEVRINIELPNATREFKEGEGEKPYMIGKSATFSMNEKSWLRKVVEACIGVSLTDGEAEAFDVEEILGKPLLVNVQHYTGKDGIKRAGIEAVAPLIKGMTAPEPVNTPTYFDVNNFTSEEYDKLPDWMKEKVKRDNATDLRVNAPAPTKIEYPEAEINPDDIPF